MNIKRARLVVAAIVVATVVISGSNAMCGEGPGSIGLGFQSSFPAYGLSGVIRANDRIAVQGILGFFGDLNSYYGRVLYRFSDRQADWGYTNLYGYGMAGLFSYPWFDNEGSPTRESTAGFGAGLGWEAQLKSTPVAFNLEIGLGVVDFKEADYKFSAIMLGAGIHYYFGGAR